MLKKSRKMTITTLTTLFCAVTLISGCKTTKGIGQKDLNEQTVLAIAWYQKSGEAKALCYQAYRNARMVLDRILNEETEGEKPALCLDLDETVLDNSPYQARLIGTDQGYNSKTWNAWCNEAKAEAVPGAIEFLKYADAKGVALFYVSNRNAAVQKATMKNMKQLGAPQVTSDNMMLKTDTSNKEPRREKIRENHRIVMLIGDNLNDFDNMFRKKKLGPRNNAVDTVKDRFGERFIILPNPLYGDFEGALYDYNWGAKPAAKSRMRKAALDR